MFIIQMIERGDRPLIAVVLRVTSDSCNNPLEPYTYKLK